MNASRLRPVLVGVCFAATLSSGPPGAAWAASAFAGFAGAWRGTGSIALGDGSREALRCKASYGIRGDGDALSLDVECASDSYRVHIVSDVTAQGRQFSGSWQETTRQAQGTVTGSIPQPGEMQASFVALGVEIQLAARTTGRRQAITLRSQGTDVKGVDLVLKRL